jgi:hypothetical protein
LASTSQTRTEKGKIMEDVERMVKEFLQHLEDQIKQIMSGPHDHATKNQQILDTVTAHSEALAAKAAPPADETVLEKAGEAKTEEPTTEPENPPADPAAETPPAE